MTLTILVSRSGGKWTKTSSFGSCLNTQTYLIDLEILYVLLCMLKVKIKIISSTEVLTRTWEF